MTKITLDNIPISRYNHSEGFKNSSILYTEIMWYHPSYYRRLAEIRREEERKAEKKKSKKALTRGEQSDIVRKQTKESISDCLEWFLSLHWPVASIKDVVAHIGIRRKFLKSGVGWKLDGHGFFSETISQTHTLLYGCLISGALRVIYKVQ